MRPISLMLVLFASGMIVGCAESPSSVMVKPPAGGGVMIRLPGNRGFVTIKTESPAATQASKKKITTRIVVASFFQADGSTPMSPAPTDVVLKLGTAENATTVALAADSQEPNRFASSPGQYPQGFQGSVHLKIGGEDVEESFSAL
jgi:hypothetical protein